MQSERHEKQTIEKITKIENWRAVRIVDYLLPSCVVRKPTCRAPSCLPLQQYSTERDTMSGLEHSEHFGIVGSGDSPIPMETMQSEHCIGESSKDKKETQNPGLAILEELYEYVIPPTHNTCGHIANMHAKLHEIVNIHGIEVFSEDAAKMIFHSLPNDEWGQFKKDCLRRHSWNLTFEEALIEVEFEEERRLKSEFWRACAQENLSVLRNEKVRKLRIEIDESYGMAKKKHRLQEFLENEGVYIYRSRYPKAAQKCVKLYYESLDVVIVD